MNTNPFTEIGAIVVAVVLVIAGGLLLGLGKIDAAFASSMFILAAGLLGVTGALKAPSATQQTQINTLQQGLQDLINLLGTHTHPAAPPTPPSTLTQPVQPINPLAPPPVNATAAPTLYVTPGTAIQTATFVPDPAVSMAAYQTGMMPAVTPPVQP